MAQTPPTNIDPAPTPAPQRNDRTTFSARVDAFVTWLTAAVAQFNAIATNVYNNAVDAYNNALIALASANSAAASAASAASSAGVTKWVSGTNYAQGVTVWSPADPSHFPYRANVALNPSTVDPFNDSANWSVQVSPAAFSSVEVLSISSDTSLTANSKNVVRAASTVRGASLLLPAGTAIASKNGAYPIKNVGAFAIPLRDQAGNLLAIIPSGSPAWAVLEDGSTSAGVWFIMCPDSRPAQAFSAATAAAVIAQWVHVSAIPGVADKALVAWIVSGAPLQLAIATRNPATGAVTLGSILSLSSAPNPASPACPMCIALSSTTALAAFDVATSDYRLVSLTLNTSTNTVAFSGSVSLPNQPTVAPGVFYESPVQLDATRVAWISAISGSTVYLNIATWAATPTGTQTAISGFVGTQDASMQHVGSGNIMVVGSSGNNIYTTSGNTPTLANSTTYTGGSYLSSVNGVIRGFAPGNGNKGVFISTQTPNAAGSAIKDKTFTITPSGTTVPAGPSNMAALSSAPMYYQGNLQTFQAGTSYCQIGTDGAGNPGFNLTMRVMRYTNDQLSEVVCGGVEGMPISRVNSTYLAGVRMAPVSANGQACIAIGLNASQQPQVYSVEVIKV